MGKGEDEQGMESMFSSKEPVISDITLDKKKQNKTQKQFMTKKKLKFGKAQRSWVSYGQREPLGLAP